VISLSLSLFVLVFGLMMMGGARTVGQERASRAWTQYLLRNDSHVLRLFQGQLRSTVACLTCGKVCLSVCVCL
jgi:hypothetical protein